MNKPNKQTKIILFFLSWQHSPLEGGAMGTNRVQCLLNTHTCTHTHACTPTIALLDRPKHFYCNLPSSRTSLLKPPRSLVYLPGSLLHFPSSRHLKTKTLKRTPTQESGGGTEQPPNRQREGREGKARNEERKRKRRKVIE